MSRSRTAASAFGLLLVGLSVLTAWGQEPKPGTLTPDELARVSGWFKTIQGGTVDPKTLEMLRDLVKNNPNLQQNPQELAKKFLEKNPEFLENPQKLGQLQSLAKQLNQGSSPTAGSTPTDPPTITPSIQPKTTPTPTAPPKPSVEPGLPNTGRRRPSAPLPVGGEGDRQDVPPPAPTRAFPSTNLPTRSPSVASDMPKPPNQMQPRGNADFQKVAGWWEKNIGSLKDTPGVKQMLAEFFQSANGDSDARWLSEAFKGMDPNKGSNSEVLTKIGESLSDMETPKLPNLGLGKLGDGWGKAIGDLAAPELGTGGGPRLPQWGGGGESWAPVIGFIVVAGLGIALWWLWPMLKRDGQNPGPLSNSLGPWPVNPRKISNRETLIKAFEYLSVLLCGHPAMTWNHVTIANRIRQQIPGSDPVADRLAQLYAIARYTPSDQPLSEATIQEARQHLCQLAGVRP